VAGDVTRPEDAAAAVERTVKEFGSLDILVNAVGGGAGGALYPAEDYSKANGIASSTST